ncbi:hypothetical protein MHBO_000592 [Bonamia ostreae]|uniref:Uncharacterized protein n=1 Tax=Bonamia ostreae TaxID=126728 RepID=A0ABV2AG75_9EUKA
MSCEEKVDKIAKILQVDKKLIPVDFINRKNEMNPVIHLSESGPYEFSKDGTIKGKMYTFSVCKILRNDEKGRTLISLTDDDTFNKYPNLVWMVPRCYSILDITDENKNETSRFILQGYRKYGGSRIDEDTGVDTSSINQVFILMSLY